MGASQNVSVTSAGLLGLGNWGGPTQTFALSPNSVAIGNGQAVAAETGVLATDQRGVSRTAAGNANADAGSYQYTTLATVTVAAGDVNGLVTALSPGTTTTINLTQSIYDFTQANNDWYGPNALPAISRTLIINGNGATLQRDPSLPNTTAGGLRFFYVSGGQSGPDQGSLSLNNLTLKGGLAKGGDGVRGGGGGLGAGGAIFNQGFLFLTGVTLTQNLALGGAGGVGIGSGGGGIGQDALPGAGGGFGGVAPGANGGAGAAGGPGLGGGGGGFRSQDNGSGDVGGGLGELGGVGGFVTHANTVATSDGGDGGVGGAPDNGGAGGGFGAGGRQGVSGGGGGVGGGGGLGSTAPDSAGGGGGFGGGGGSGAYGGFGGFGGGGGNSSGKNATAALGGFGGGAGSTNSNGQAGGGAGLGGAVFSMYGSVTVVNSTFNLNAADGGVGGNSGIGNGGAFFNLDGTVNLTNATLDGDSVTTDRGINGGELDNLAYGNLPDGTASNATVTILNSILANSLGTGANLFNDTETLHTSAGATVTLSGPNIIQISISTLGGGGITGTQPILSDPNLGALTSNGGPTPTMAIQATSPAFDKGSDSVLGAPLNLATDQRGLPRKSGAHVDIGAFELQVGPAVTTNTGFTVAPNSQQAIDPSQLQATEAGVAPAQITFTVTAVPTTGVLLKNGVALAVGGTFTQADVNNRLVAYASSAASTLTDSFTFTVSDPSGISTGPNTFAITYGQVEAFSTINGTGGTGLFVQFANGTVYSGGRFALTPVTGVATLPGISAGLDTNGAADVAVRYASDGSLWVHTGNNPGAGWTQLTGNYDPKSNNPDDPRLAGRTIKMFAAGMNGVVDVVFTDTTFWRLSIANPGHALEAANKAGTPKTGISFVAVGVHNGQQAEFVAFTDNGGGGVWEYFGPGVAWVPVTSDDVYAISASWDLSDTADLILAGRTTPLGTIADGSDWAYRGPTNGLMPVSSPMNGLTVISVAVNALGNDFYVLSNGSLYEHRKNDPITTVTPLVTGSPTPVLLAQAPNADTDVIDFLFANDTLWQVTGLNSLETGGNSLQYHPIAD